MAENKAVTARSNRMLDALDLAIDWMATETSAKGEYNWGTVISTAGRQTNCTDQEINTLVDEAFELSESKTNWSSSENKLNSLVLLRDKYANP